MTLNLQPVPHQIFNEFDRFGQLLDLKRIEGEDNVSYRRRLLDVMVRRSDSTYIGLIYGVTRELGLRILDVMNIKPVVDGNDVPVAPQPAIIFRDTKCSIYSDMDNNVLDVQFDRYSSQDCCTMGGLVDLINANGIFTATLLADAEPQFRSMMIFNQRSINDATDIDISDAGVRIVLPNTNLIKGTVGVSSANMQRRVYSETEVVKSGDYFINLEDGIILTAGSPAEGSSVRYKYRNDDLTIQASPVIIHDLQSADFKEKMFDQISDGNGEVDSGLPTNLGADIINELLSVYPSLWGR